MPMQPSRLRADFIPGQHLAATCKNFPFGFSICSIAQLLGQERGSVEEARWHWTARTGGAMAAGLSISSRGALNQSINPVGTLPDVTKHAYMRPPDCTLHVIRFPLHMRCIHASSTDSPAESTVFFAAVPGISDLVCCAAAHVFLK